MHLDWFAMLKQFYLSELVMFSQYTSPMRTPEVSSRAGYPLETHTVRTDDGYLLGLHRLPNPGGPVVLLMHCMFCSSFEFLCLGKGKALGFMLYDAGYDVWLGNARGNTYSRKHVSLRPESHAFWDFSWHEIGLYDVPAMIDHALNATGARRLHYVGHSQGTTAFFVMTSLRPEYNDKVAGMQALAPVAYMSHVKSPAVLFSCSVLSILQNLASIFGVREFFSSNIILTTVSGIFCRDQIWTQGICTAVLNFISGYNAAQTNTTILPYLFSNTPAGGSVDLLFHYGQLVNSGKFRQFDYGQEKNLRIYKSAEPPDYDLDKITVPIVIHYSRNDWLSDTKDVENLMAKLKSLAGAYLVTDADWAHLDYVWGIDADTKLYNHVINIADKYKNKLN